MDWIASKDQLPTEDAKVLVANISNPWNLFIAEFSESSGCFYHSSRFQGRATQPAIRADMWMMIDPAIVPTMWIDINEKTPSTSGFRRYCLVRHKEFGEIYLGWWHSDLRFFTGDSSETNLCSPPPLLVTHWLLMPDHPSREKYEI